MVLLNAEANACCYLAPNLRAPLERHRWDLVNRRIEAGNENEIRVVPGPDDRLDPAWHWRLAREDTGWCISYLEGAPLEAGPAGARDEQRLR